MKPTTIGVRADALLVFALATAACSPAAPSDPGAPHLACPAAPAPAQAVDASGAVVSYGNATATLGTPPLSAPACNPASGSKFPIGTTTVTCTVTDAHGLSGICTFPVVVQSPGTLAFTRFVAFGDSITAGQIVGEGLVTPAAARVGPRLVDPYLSYPADLTRDLTLRYPTQQPYVFNQGVSGEDTKTGLGRLPSVLNPFNQQRPQVLLLMDGANDISNGLESSITPAVLNLDAMVRQAKDSNVKVIVGTIPPENPVRLGSALVVPLNDAVKAMAASEGVPLADVYQAFNGDVTTLIDFDGLHPTAAGYEVIANAFLAVIQTSFGTPAAQSMFEPGPARAFTVQRRSR